MEDFLDAVVDELDDESLEDDDMYEDARTTVVSAGKASTSYLQRKLRIGYVSADFHHHATAFLISELFERHDRKRYDIFAYSCGIDDKSPKRARIASAVD